VKNIERLIEMLSIVAPFIRMFLALQMFTASLANAESVNLVTGNDYPPYADENLPARGMTTELMNAIYTALDDTAKFSFRPWKRGDSETLKRKFLGTFPYIKSAKREAEFLYSDPIFTYTTEVFASSNTQFSANSLADLEGKTICNALVYVNSIEVEVMLTHNRMIRLSQSLTIDHCFTMLDAAGVDIIESSYRFAKASMLKMGYENSRFRTLGVSKGQTILHFIVPKSNPNAEQEINRFNAGLTRIKSDGTFDKILSKH
jgi:polar amino acid transport system substrate-binding protein